MTESRKLDHIAGPGIALRGTNIDTDRIIPARFLKSITFEGLGEHVFEDDRASMPDHPFSNPVYRQAKILFANENFGSGSSREHAPQALKRWGIEACVAESFSEIFQGNALAIGLPCATATREDVEAVMAAIEKTPDTNLTLSVSTLALQAADREVTLHIPAGVREALLSGHWDATGLLLDQFDEVEAVAASLPYVRQFEDS